MSADSLLTLDYVQVKKLALQMLDDVKYQSVFSLLSFKNMLDTGFGESTRHLQTLTVFPLIQGKDFSNQVQHPYALFIGRYTNIPLFYDSIEDKTIHRDLFNCNFLKNLWREMIISLFFLPSLLKKIDMFYIQAEM